MPPESKFPYCTMELLNEYQESECAIAEDRVTYYADRLDGRTEDEQMDERTRTEQNGVGITDELREYVDQKDGWGMTHTHAKAIAAIADSIDEQHAVKVERLEKYRAAVCAMLKEYVKLPMDADGVPIRVGDSVALGDGTFEVRRLELYDRDSWDVLDRFGEPFSPLNLRHVQPDSWECIIHDATGAGWMGEGVFDEKDFERIEAELVERCKRLAGDAE